MNASPHIQLSDGHETKKKEDKKEVYTDRYYGKVYAPFTLQNDIGENRRQSGPCGWPDTSVAAAQRAGTKRNRMPERALWPLFRKEKQLLWH